MKDIIKYSETGPRQNPLFESTNIFLYHSFVLQWQVYHEYCLLELRKLIYFNRSQFYLKSVLDKFNCTQDIQKVCEFKKNIRYIYKYILRSTYFVFSFISYFLNTLCILIIIKNVVTFLINNIININLLQLAINKIKIRGRKKNYTTILI